MEDLRGFIVFQALVKPVSNNGKCYVTFITLGGSYKLSYCKRSVVAADILEVR